MPKKRKNTWKKFKNRGNKENVRIFLSSTDAIDCYFEENFLFLQAEPKNEMEEENNSDKNINTEHGRVHNLRKSYSRGDHKCSKGHRHRKCHQAPKPTNSTISKKENSNVGESEEMISPLEMNLDVAYQHVKSENNKLKIDLENLRDENEEVRITGDRLLKENEGLKEDVSLLKNLVYKLNVELERYQTGGGNVKSENLIGRIDKLPKNYDNNFLRPVVPLLKAYSESLQEKDDTIKDLESEYKKFNVAFNEIIQENEKLYGELEKKMMDPDRNALNELKVLKKDLNMAKEENNLLFEQIKLEKEKLVKIHSVFKVKGK